MIDVAAYCLKNPLFEETYPFGPDATVYKVRGKMFALAPDTEHPTSINFKCNPVRAILLRQEHSEIIPGYHTNQTHWNTLDFTGGLPDEVVQELTDQLYDLVTGK